MVSEDWPELETSQTKPEEFCQYGACSGRRNRAPVARRLSGTYGRNSVSAIRTVGINRETG